MLLTHWIRRAASRADWTAGSSRAMSTAMIAITTSNSISVKPWRRRIEDDSRFIISRPSIYKVLWLCSKLSDGAVWTAGGDGAVGPSARKRGSERLVRSR